MGLNQHDAPLWALRKGQKVARFHALRSLENDDVLAALRHDRITAPCVFDGLINGETFLAYVEQALAPTLSPGEAAGATQRFLPAYSPDLDPIEQVFAKLKNTLRKMAHRTVDALWEGIGSALDDFPPHECLNYFRNAKYGSA